MQATSAATPVAGLYAASADGLAGVVAGDVPVVEAARASVAVSQGQWTPVALVQLALGSAWPFVAAGSAVQAVS